MFILVYRFLRERREAPIRDWLLVCEDAKRSDSGCGNISVLFAVAFSVFVDEYRQLNWIQRRLSRECYAVKAIVRRQQQRRMSRPTYAQRVAMFCAVFRCVRNVVQNPVQRLSGSYSAVPKDLSPPAGKQFEMRSPEAACQNVSEECQ